jgi:hypothetical protein
MIKEGLPTGSLFRVPTEKEGIETLDDVVEDDANEKEPRKEKNVLCRHCLQLITNPAEIIEVQGSHQHTFANPEGILFQIGCFKSAVGCGHVGPATYAWSWFKGFRWSVALCSMCLTHLGWLYTSPGSESFYGLILSRLISPDEWS